MWTINGSSLDLSLYDYLIHPKYGYYMIVSTLVSFHFLNKFVATVGPRPPATVDDWKWRNLCCSFVHALASGTWSFWCVTQYPEMINNLFNFTNVSCYGLAAFSTGYFLYDFFDIIVNNKVGKNWEVCLHHVPVCAAMIYNVSFLQMIGYHVVVMTLEINSVFLHSRKLLQLTGVAQRSLAYRLNSVANVLTFVAFRFGAIACVASGLWWEYERISAAYFPFISVTTFLIGAINVVLFYRLIRNDVLRRDYRVNNNVNKKNPS